MRSREEYGTDAGVIRAFVDNSRAPPGLGAAHPARAGAGATSRDARSACSGWPTRRTPTRRRTRRRSPLIRSLTPWPVQRVRSGGAGISGAAPECDRRRVRPRCGQGRGRLGDHDAVAGVPRAVVRRSRAASCAAGSCSIPIVCSTPAGRSRRSRLPHARRRVRRRSMLALTHLNARPRQARARRS